MKRIKRYKIAVIILSLLAVSEGVALIHLLGRPRRFPLPPAPAAVGARIAIVIDDWGYNLNNLDILEQLSYHLTMAVLPNLAHSAKVSNELQRRGFEIILHLPLEPHEKYRLERNTIMVSMNDKTAVNILNNDLSNVAYARGVSNHMGSKATQDLRIMQAIFSELKKRQLYFLDSFVSPNSLCRDLAKKMHLGFIRRDIFLDNKYDPAYIRAQVYKLAAKANLYGESVGIGHCRRVTLEVLKELIPKLEKQGYKFVFVSELIK